MKQTAVEFLFEKLTLIWHDSKSSKDILEIAKEMEKEQIMWAHESGIGCIDYGYAEDYYNETFKSE
jgi:hypothetical protein